MYKIAHMIFFLQTSNGLKFLPTFCNSLVTTNSIFYNFLEFKIFSYWGFECSNNFTCAVAWVQRQLTLLCMHDSFLGTRDTWTYIQTIIRKARRKQVWAPENREYPGLLLCRFQLGVCFSVSLSFPVNKPGLCPSQLQTCQMEISLGC